MYTVASMSNTAGHGLPFVDASEVGMSAERLARIENRFKSYVDESFLSGWALTVAREGKIALSASCGLADRENNKPISDDTIYRICGKKENLNCMIMSQSSFLNSAIRKSF
ncbi:MAG: hypothetical protein RIS69_1554 [Actinomycetota bacterium]